MRGKVCAAVYRGDNNGYGTQVVAKMEKQKSK
jgi:hypothetical protein